MNATCNIKTYSVLLLKILLKANNYFRLFGILSLNEICLKLNRLSKRSFQYTSSFKWKRVYVTIKANQNETLINKNADRDPQYYNILAFITISFTL